MRSALKGAVVVVPFFLVFLVIRACAGGEAERWLGRVAEIDPAAVLGVADDDLIVIAPDRQRAVAAGDLVRSFRRGILEEYDDLFVTPREHRMVVVVFSTPDLLRAWAGGRFVPDPSNLHGYTDAVAGAIFVPADDPKTLRHETVHWVVGAARRRAPEHSPWLNEGLAQLFETFDPDARPSTPPGLGPEERALVRMLIGETIDVDRLLDLDDYRKFVGGNGARNYLEALVLTAFLFEMRPRELLRRYIQEEWGTTIGRPVAFEALFNHRGETFLRDLREFVAALKSG